MEGREGWVLYLTDVWLAADFLVEFLNILATGCGLT